MLRMNNPILEKIRREISIIPKRGIKNVSYLTAGNFAVELINIIGFIYIARLLGAKDYGIYVTVGTFVAMFDFILLGGIEKSLIREGSKNVTMMQVQLENTIGIRNVLITVAITACIVSSLFTGYALPTKLYIVLFSFQLMYLGLRGILSTVFQAAERMKYMAFFGIFNRILFVGLSIGALYLGLGITSIFIISLFSNALTLLLNYSYSKKIVNFNIFSRVRLDMNIVKPGIIFSLMTFVNYFMTRVDLLMISFLGTPTDVGIYGVSFRIAEQGIALRNLTATAFFPIFIKRFHSGKVNGKRLLRISLFFFVLFFLVTLAASFVVEDLVAFVFGREYQPSGHILRVLLFFLALSWANIPFTTAAQATHNEKYLLMISSIAAVLNVILNYLFFLKFGLIGIAYSTLVVVFVRTALEISICYRVMKLQGHLI